MGHTILSSLIWYSFKSDDMTWIDIIDQNGERGSRINDNQNGERGIRESDNQKGERQKKRSLDGSELR